MGYKIFVSYKYHDNSVAFLNEGRPSTLLGSCGRITTVRDYVDYLENDIIDHSYNIYKGESDNEDLSYLSEDSIWEKLKDRIYDSSVTIVLISPEMKEPYRSERSQWIPWEIAYSLRETTRNDRTSHSNAILAVILPDKSYQYNYFTYPFSYQQADGQWCNGKDPVFSIIRNNMNNSFYYDNSFLKTKGCFPISLGEESYIPSVKWIDFIQNPNKYIEIAVVRKEHIYEYNICKEV